MYVLLEEASSSVHRDEPGGSPTDQSELVAVLREQLAAERQAHAEARRIIAGLVERIPAIESPVSAEEPSEGAEPRPGTGEAQERPWWRFWR